jgi:UDP-2-acetamido-2-deoxy-ribo-hexuluronate aminotransferase
MKIPFVDLKTQYLNIKDEVDLAAQKVHEHGCYIMGPEVSELESQLANYTNCKHVITVSSGTDALLAILLSQNVGKGDAVFIPSFTFTATAEVVMLIGAEPVFVDIDPQTFNIDINDLSEKIEFIKQEGRLNPKIIMPVDLFGLPVDYDAIKKLVEDEGLFILADAAQSFGGSYKEKKVGTLADATATSFFPAKPLGCYGDGGAVLTNNDDCAEIIRSIRLHGKGSSKYEIERVGLNARLDTIQAAMMLPKLKIFPEELEKREELARYYDERLKEFVMIPKRINGNTSAWAQYTILVKNREHLSKSLKEKGIPTAVYYPRPIHKQKAYKKFASKEGCPVSERISNEVLSLPMHPYMEKNTAKYICDELINAVTKLS